MGTAGYMSPEQLKGQAVPTASSLSGRGGLIHLTPSFCGTEDASNPFWSPDGRSLGFFAASSKLEKIEFNGGPAQVLTGTFEARLELQRSDSIIEIHRKDLVAIR